MSRIDQSIVPQNIARLDAQGLQCGGWLELTPSGNQGEMSLTKLENISELCHRAIRGVNKRSQTTGDRSKWIVKEGSNRWAPTAFWEVFWNYFIADYLQCSNIAIRNDDRRTDGQRDWMKKALTNSSAFRADHSSDTLTLSVNGRVLPTSHLENSCCFTSNLY